MDICGDRRYGIYYLDPGASCRLIKSALFFSFRTNKKCLGKRNSSGVFYFVEISPSAQNIHSDPEFEVTTPPGVSGFRVVEFVEGIGDLDKRFHNSPSI